MTPQEAELRRMADAAWALMEGCDQPWFDAMNAIYAIAKDPDGYYEKMEAERDEIRASRDVRAFVEEMETPVNVTVRDMRTTFLAGVAAAAKSCGVDLSKVDVAKMRGEARRLSVRGRTCVNLYPGHPSDGFICSRCGFADNDHSRIDRWDMSDWDNTEESFAKMDHCECSYVFCPNCGAEVTEA